MRISNIFEVIAATALCCLCNRLCGEIIRDGGFYYVTGYAQVRSQSDASKENALTRAELSAQEEFAKFAVSEKAILPNELAPLSGKIKYSVFYEHISGAINNAKIIRNVILKDGRACCVLQIPQKNIENFPVIDFTKDHKRLIAGLARNKLLQLETALILKYPEGELFPENSKIQCCRKRLPLKSVPESWLAKDMGNIPVEKFNDSELCLAAEMFVGIDETFKRLVGEISRRGYPLSASMLSGIKIPVSAPVKIDVSVNADGEIPLVKILSQKKSSISFENSAEKNDSADDALSEFYNPKPDFKKVREYALTSLAESVSDTMFNLIGRTYEEEKKWSHAILFYAQAVSINEDTPYAKANLAKCFYELKNYDMAAYWANRALERQPGTEWTVQRAKEILNLIKDEDK